jgi:death-on-curing family protein
MISWWPSLDDAVEAHCAAMALDGVAPSHHDEARLAGALYRPQNHHHYDGVDDVVELATLLAIAVARSHAFTDGNKRTGYVLMGLFLLRNGVELTTGNGDDSIAKWIEHVVEAYQSDDETGDAELARFTHFTRTVTIHV